MGLPSHSSGVSSIAVSPNRGGTIGPIETFGYPSLPTKTPGGDDPRISFVDIAGPCFAMAWALTMIGHLGFPQSSLAPRHARHIQAGGFSTTSIDLATSSSSPVTEAAITLESQVILLGTTYLDLFSALKLGAFPPDDSLSWARLRWTRSPSSPPGRSGPPSSPVPCRVIR